MKRSLVNFGAFVLLSILISCQSKSAQKLVVQQKKHPAEFDKDSLTTDFMTYWSYHYNFVKLFKDFIPTDTAGKIIDKATFLSDLSRGLYFPLLHSTKDSIWQYGLVKIPPKIIKDAGRVIAADAVRQLGYFNQEKTSVPNFNFKDVNGVTYSSTNTKGKIVLIKCWYLACQSCVEEIPELNKMAEKYKDRKDILFLSLASDDKEHIKSFLKRTPFDYKVVPNQDYFMTEKLKVPLYPTHFLIDKQGKIMKVVNEASDLEALLAVAAKDKS